MKPYQVYLYSLSLDKCWVQHEVESDIINMVVYERCYPLELQVRPGVFRVVIRISNLFSPSGVGGKHDYAIML